MLSGRIAMVVAMLLGAALTLWGDATLFDTVAVSGTASMFLSPVLVVGLVPKRQVAVWTYLLAYAAALLGAFASFARNWPVVATLLLERHKYEHLLAICIVVLVSGFAAVLAGARKG